MKLTWRWITEFLRTDLTPQTAADRLTNGGVEAGSVARLAPDLAHVVIGEIEAIERDLGGPPGHPRVLVRVSTRSEEHTSELQSHSDLVCRLLLEKKNSDTPTST